METLIPVLVCAVLGGGTSWFVPRVVAAVPEPEPEPGTPSGPVKVLYVDIAATPHLAWRSVLVGVLAGALIGAAVGWDLALVWLLPAVPLGIALSVIDWRTKRLPTWLIAPCYPALVVLVVLVTSLTRHWDDLLRAGLGWLVMGGFYLLTNLVSARLVGFGDVRLSGLLGIILGYLGWGELLLGMYVAFFVFGIPPLVLAVARRDRSVLRMRMPFGPAMLAGALLGIVFGADLARWYLDRLSVS